MNKEALLRQINFKKYQAEQILGRTHENDERAKSFHYGRVSALREIGSLAEQLETTEKEKVKVPGFAADFTKSRDTTSDVFYYLTEHSNKHKKVHDWLCENRKKCECNYRFMARIITNGYEVEEEKLYHVIFDKDESIGIITYLKKDVFDENDYFINHGIAKEMKEEISIFTEQEIKAIDERYWQFAVPVSEVE